MKRTAMPLGGDVCLTAHGSSMAAYCTMPREQGWKDGWAHFKFVDIFGAKPRSQDRGPPMPPPMELKAWIALLPKGTRPKKRTPIINGVPHE
jgi:hypothetical protein